MKLSSSRNILVAIGVVLSGLGSLAQLPSASPAASVSQESQVEMYRIAPGQQKEFIKFIALCDEANKEAKMPPRQLYVHQDGASWDFLIIQPLHTTDVQDKAWFAAATRLGIPHGGNFFLAIRKYVEEHTDTATTGPTTAADWLAQLQR